MDSTEGRDDELDRNRTVNTTDDEFLEYLKLLTEEDESFNNVGIDQSLYEEFRNTNFLYEVGRSCGINVEPVSLNQSAPLDVCSSSVDEPEQFSITSPTVTSSGIVEKPEEEEDSILSSDESEHCSTSESATTAKTETNRNYNSPKQSSSQEDEFTEVQSKQKDNVKNNPVSAPHVSSSSSTLAIRGENFSRKLVHTQRQVKRHDGHVPKIHCKSKKVPFSQHKQQSQEPQRQLSSVGDTSQKNAPSTPCSMQQFSEDIPKSQETENVLNNLLTPETTIVPQTGGTVHITDLARLANLFSGRLTDNTSVQITPRLLEEITLCERRFGPLKANSQNTSGSESNSIPEKSKATSTTTKTSPIRSKDGRKKKRSPKVHFDNTSTGSLSKTFISNTAESTNDLADVVGTESNLIGPLVKDAEVSGSTSASFKENQSNKQVWPMVEKETEDPSSLTKVLTRKKLVLNDNDTTTSTMKSPQVESITNSLSDSQDPTITKTVVKEKARAMPPLLSQNVPKAKTPSSDEVSSSTPSSHKESKNVPKPKLQSSTRTESRRPELSLNTTTELSKLLEPVDVEKEPGDAEKEPGDAEKEPGDAEKEPGDAEKEPGDAENEPADAEKEPVDVENEPVDVENEPVDVENEPVDVENEPVNVENEPVNVENEPVDVENEPAGVENEPAGVENEPAGVENEPAGVENEPAGVENEPAGVENEPAGVEKEPVDVEKEPVDVEKEPTEDRETSYNRPDDTAAGGEDEAKIECQEKQENNKESNSRINFSETKQEILESNTVDVEEIVYDPEIPLSNAKLNAFAEATMAILEHDPNPSLPDVEAEKNLAEVTVMKVAWWISKGDFENSKESGSKDDWYKNANNEETLENDSVEDYSFLDLLEFTSEDDEVYESLPIRMRTKESGPVDELCGRQLLKSRYRAGPSDKFSNIFQVRGFTYDPAEAYDKKTFQANCTLCDCLIVGQNKLASHVFSDLHRENMSKAGLNDLKTAQTEKTKENKKTESSNKKEEREKSVAAADQATEKKDKKKDEDSKDKNKKEKEKRHKDKKRKRSKDRSSSEGSRSRDASGAEIGVTSTGLPIKIPPGAIPDKSKKRSDSKDKRSRSRSPRPKRNRSRSPRHHRERSFKTRSRSPHASRRRRSRSESRDHARERGREPIVKISRSPGKSRRRSTSAEQAEKFLAKIRQRSRSPSNGYRKRPSPTPMTAVLPKKTNKEFHEKMALTLDGKWTLELEKKWKLMEVQEAMFMEQFAEKSNSLKITPENHPKYSDEWKAFWERRYHEVENDGKDPDKYDYVPEWKDFWTNRLRELLEIEYEEEIMKIKVQNGVDIDTLKKLANSPLHSVMPVLQAEPIQLQSQLQIPQAVPPPVCLPMGVPPPHQQILVPQMLVTSLPGTNTPCSDMGGDDMISRPMSISDGSDGYIGTKTNVPPSVPSPVVTTGDIMSAWEKLKSGGIPAGKQGGSSVPTPRVPQPFLSLSRKSSEDKSTSDSVVTIDSFKFSTEIDVTQVLFKMSQLEDQLSFFADKVKEYFHKAEQMDLEKRNKSYKLLTDDDFVAMLYQIKDRFMAMIRARILPKDVLDKLNYAVYGLNGLMEHPDCKERRPRLSVNTPEIPPPQEANTVRSNNVNDTFTRPTGPSAQSRNPLRFLSDGKQHEIAGLVASFLNFMGRTDLADNELKELLWRVCQPITSSAKAPSFTGSIRNSASNTTAQGGDYNRQRYNSNIDSGSNSRSSVRFGENANLDPWQLPERNMTKVGSVASFRSSGPTVPQLPNVIPHFTNPVGGSGPLRFGSSNGSEGSDGSWGRGQNISGGDNYMSSSSSGRHSPFSRRGFSGNPVPANSSNPNRDKAGNALDASSTSTSNKECSFGPTSSRENQANHVDDISVNKTLQEANGNPAEVKMAQMTGYKSDRQSIDDTRADLGGGGDASVREELTFNILRDENIEQVGRITSKRASIEEITTDGLCLPTCLPPGIMNMIMQERRTKLRQQEEDMVKSGNGSADEPNEFCYYYRRGKRKRKRKKRRSREKYRSISRSSVEDSDGSKHSRDRSKERRSRRERMIKKNERENLKSSALSSAALTDKRGRENTRNPLPLLDRGRENRRRRNGRHQSRSPSHEQERRRRESGRRNSREDSRRVRNYYKSPSQSPNRPSSSKKIFYTRHSQKSGEVLSDWSESGVKVVKRVGPAIGEENPRVEDRRNSWLSPAKSETSSVVELLMDQGAIRRAPPLYENSHSKYFLRENNLRAQTARESAGNHEMVAVSPPASVNSGSSGYRRTKERPRRTTINVPKQSNLRFPDETWDVMSEVSSLSEDKKSHKIETSAKSNKEKIMSGQTLVTSVSKTFWTEKDEDLKSLSSISSHDLSSCNKMQQEQEGQKSQLAGVAAPASASKKVSRNYRTSFEDSKESGEVSSSSSDFGEL